MRRTLQPDDRIAHYRIVGPLGTGGMGEVHAAKDEKLGRSVALKILPPSLVRNEERVRRFVTEARSASSLNHPNIVTIYEIGHDRVIGGDAGEACEVAEGPIHYIAMELVTGKTLGEKIHRERTDLRTLIGYLAQAAEGVAKAHAAGVVHRDLKPGNIMVSADGFAKVLDFGLAKLTEREGTSDGDATSAPTSDPATGEGTVLGTVGYMSPEQVQAKPTDHRSDVFSIGVILYEAAARRRPFVADTDVEVMSAILRQEPPPLEEFDPTVPSALRRLIRRCLAKNPDHRLHSMKDLALELREIADEWDSLDIGSSSTGSSRSAAAAASSGGGRRTLVLVVAAVLLGAGGLGYGIYSSWQSGRAPTTGAEAARGLQMSSILSMSDLTEATLSADGRYLAYVSDRGGSFDLRVRQVRTGSDIAIVSDSDVFMDRIAFSRDGDYLFFLQRDPTLPNYSALFRVASLGGTPRKVLFDVDSAPTFSPDGGRFCFFRGMPQEQTSVVMTAEIAGGEESELTRVAHPAELRAAPAWSPDGRTIAIAVRDLSGGARCWVEVVDAASGQRERLSRAPWLDVGSIAWLPGGEGLVVSALDLANSAEPQLYRLGFPGGEGRRITSDLDGYRDASVSTADGTIAALRRSTVSNLWVAQADGEAQLTPLTTASGSAASMGDFAPLPGHAAAFTAARDNHFFVWRIEADGSERRQLTTDGIWVLGVEWSPDHGIVFTQVDEEPDIVPHVWRMQADGTARQQLTHGSGEILLDLPPSGDVILFRRIAQSNVLWALHLSGDEPYVLAERTIDEFQVSPDGRQVLVTRPGKGESGRLYPMRDILPIDGGDPVSTFRLPPGAARLQWMPSGDAVSYIDRQGGWNLMRKTLPDGEPEPLTSYHEGRVVGYSWSPDGSRLAIHRAIGHQQSLWQVVTGESEPTLVARYEVGDLSRYQWAPDAPLLYFVYSTSTQDVVLMSGME